MHSPSSFTHRIRPTSRYPYRELISSKAFCLCEKTTFEDVDLRTRLSFVLPIGYLLAAGLPIASSTAANSALSCRGFRRKATRPAIWCSPKTASSWAVIMIVGIQKPSSAKRCWSAKPLMVGICRSTIRHLGTPFGNVARNSSPESNVRTLNARDRNSRLKALSTARSSSTTAIQGGISDTPDHAVGVGCRLDLPSPVRPLQLPMRAPFHHVRCRATCDVPPGDRPRKSGTLPVDLPEFLSSSAVGVIAPGRKPTAATGRALCDFGLASMWPRLPDTPRRKSISRKNISELN